jgi:16S rRNA (adenine1518-N6/adenine1519-N6)-dimethyltransferase
LLAKPGTRDYGSLSVLVQLLTDVELCTELGPDCFFPAPKVVSSFLRMRPKKDVRLSDAELCWLERVVRAGFGQRRKTLVKALKSLGEGNAGSGMAAEVLRALGIDPRVRAEALHPAQFLEVARRLASDRRSVECVAHT